MAKARKGQDEAEKDTDDTQSVWRSEPAAVYGLEHPVTCSSCRCEIDQLFAVRLFRARANFMSSLPRSGRVLVCPSCRAIVSGELGAVL